MHKRRSGLGLFFQSMALTLALLVPLAAATHLLVQQRRQQSALLQAGAAQSGVPVEPGAQGICRLLLAVQGEEPEFMLLRVDAPANVVTLCAVPGQALVQAPNGQTTLAACYEAAGPARAAELLGATVGISPEHYFAATAATWAELVPKDLHAVLDVRPLLPAAALPGLPLGENGTVELTPASCEEFLAAARKAAGPLPALRAQAWAALLRADTAQLAAAAANARQYSARTLTDLSANDLHTLEQTLGYLARQPSPSVEYDALPTVDGPGGAQLTAQALARAAALLS